MIGLKQVEKGLMVNLSRPSYRHLFLASLHTLAKILAGGNRWKMICDCRP
jgi:hypothetical protein